MSSSTRPQEYMKLVDDIEKILLGHIKNASEWDEEQLIDALDDALTSALKASQQQKVVYLNRASKLK